jgi:hypothetical protein
VQNLFSDKLLDQTRVYCRLFLRFRRSFVHAFISIFSFLLFNKTLIKIFHQLTMKIFLTILICNRLQWEEFFMRKSRRNNTFHFSFSILRDFQYHHKIARPHYVEYVGYENERKYRSSNVFSYYHSNKSRLNNIKLSGKSEVDASRDSDPPRRRSCRKNIEEIVRRILRERT